jgi:xylulose-5-phosphate/fructose-6-phosphate phosphoketolase
MSNIASRIMTVVGSGDVEIESISAYGTARSTVSEKPLGAEDIRKLNLYFKASLYLCLGMLYLKENPLLKQPLSKQHLKARLLGHWGSDAGQVFT